mmetsp:Transcript_2783/g.8975  ORF Transcript_2783/g.8975 Transcript_2783/m.8975 type:complete len:208 (-) Transcript_2783:662-1285(-)
MTLTAAPPSSSGAIDDPEDDPEAAAAAASSSAPPAARSTQCGCTVPFAGASFVHVSNTTVLATGGHSPWNTPSTASSAMMDVSCPLYTLRRCVRGTAKPPTTASSTAPSPLSALMNSTTACASSASSLSSLPPASDAASDDAALCTCLVSAAARMSARSSAPTPGGRGNPWFALACSGSHTAVADGGFGSASKCFGTCASAGSVPLR